MVWCYACEKKKNIGKVGNSEKMFQFSYKKYVENQRKKQAFSFYFSKKK